MSINVPFDVAGYIPGKIEPIFSGGPRVIDSSINWEKLWESVRESNPGLANVETPSVNFKSKKVVMFPIFNSLSDHSIKSIRLKADESLNIGLHQFDRRTRKGYIFGKTVTLLAKIDKSVDYRKIEGDDPIFCERIDFGKTYPEWSGILVKCTRLALDLGKVEIEARQMYGSVVYSKVRTEEDIDRIPKIDDNIFWIFRQILQMRREHKNLVNDFHSCGKRFSRGLKGPKLIAIQGESEPKKRKVSVGK